MVLGTVPGAAQIAMPDPSMIHGRAIPVGDLATGTVTVRVVVPVVKLTRPAPLANWPETRSDAIGRPLTEQDYLATGVK